MLRHRKTASGGDDHKLDALDEQLIRAVEAELPLRQVLSSVPCAFEDAQARLMRLMHLGVIEDDTRKPRHDAGADDEDPFDDEPTGLLEADMRDKHSGVSAKVSASQPASASSGVHGQPAVLDDETRGVLAEAAALLARAAQCNYYQLLDVSPQADPETLRKAYGSLARRFHPDVFFRKPIGEHRRTLELLFAALTRAHDVLRVPEQRVAYDYSQGIVQPRMEPQPSRAVGVFSRSAAPTSAGKTAPMASAPLAPPRMHTPSAPSLPTRPPEVQITSRPPAPSAPSEPARSASAAPAPASVPPQSARPSAQTYSVRPAVEVVRVPTGTSGVRPAPTLSSPPGSARQSLMRDLMARKGGAPPAPAPSSPKDSSPYSRPPPATLESLAQELAKGEANARWAATGLREAHALEQRGERASALALLQVVVARFSDPRVREQRDRLLNLTRTQASVDHRERAVAAQNAKNYAEAAEHWRKVCEADRKDGKAALQAAFCYISAREHKQAGPYAMRAVELAPTDINARKVLLRFYELMGMELNASRERQALAKLAKK